MRLPFRLAAVLALALSANAWASPFAFVYTPTGAAVPSASFIIYDRTLTSYDPYYFYAFPVAVSLLANDGTTVTTMAGVQFSDGYIGFNSNDEGLHGATVFSGGLTNPSFLAGTYAVSFLGDDSRFPLRGGGTLVVSEIPEPTSIALLGTGLLGVGAAVRRRFTAR